MSDTKYQARTGKEKYLDPVILRGGDYAQDKKRQKNFSVTNRQERWSKLLLLLCKTYRSRHFLPTEVFAKTLVAIPYTSVT